MNPKPKVLITVPVGSNTVHAQVALFLLRVAKDARFDIHVQIPSRNDYIHNLHTIRMDFLAADYDWWLTLDGDNPPRHGANPLDDILQDLDIIGFPTPMWKANTDGDWPVIWNVMDEVYDEDDNFTGWRQHICMVGLQKVDAVGSGCLLIARRVLEAIDAPFMREWNRDGVATASGDFMFCRRAAELGFGVYADFDRPCYHFNEVELGEALLMFKPFLDQKELTSGRPA